MNTLDWVIAGVLGVGFIVGFIRGVIRQAFSLGGLILGLILGKKFGTKLAGKASILGGIILILIGAEIFIKGVFF